MNPPKKTNLIAVGSGPLRLRDIATDAKGEYASKDETFARLEVLRVRMNELQEHLYAEGKQSLLIVFQAMDTGGKDGATKNLLTGLDPAGVNVKSFKVPSTLERSHDFLWRIHAATPPGGYIGVWNRSHYEDVLVPVVHKLIGHARAQNEQSERLRTRMAEKLNAGELEESEVEVEVEEKRNSNVALFAPGLDENGDMGQMFSNLFPQNKKKRRLKVREARPILEQQEAERLLDRDAIISEAIERAQENGIVFLDEIDKIAGREGAGNPQVSREGVQRDLLPLVEGATVNTKYGPVSTDHMLFIAAGAFHVSKPSDLIPELQGRFPIRVELEPLTEEDLRRILIEPQNALTSQYGALLGADGLQVEFTPDGIAEIARFAAQVNDTTENIGARRLHTLVEKVLEDASFEAPESDEKQIRINATFVRARLAHLVSDDDLSRFIL